MLEPGGLHHPGVVVLLDGDLAGGVHLGGALHIGGLIHRHRGQLSQLLGGLFDQLPGALMGCGGDLKQFQPKALHVGAELVQQGGIGHDVRLVGGHDHLAGGQLGGVLLQLGVDGLEVLHRVPALAARDVHHMDEQAAAVDVAQKVVAQSGAVGGALNDAGDVRHDEGDALLHIHHAQVGEKGGEVIIGDLGLSPADHAEQRGLTHVGEAHQPHISQQLQLQHHLAALAGIASLGKAGDLPGGGGEVLVAPAAPAAPAEDEGGVIRHIVDDLLGGGVPDDGAPGDPQDQVCAVSAGAALAASVCAVGGGVLALIAEVHQGGHMVVHCDHHVAAPAAVAAVRAAGGHIFFPVEGDHAVAAVAGADGDLCGIYKGCCHTERLLTV